MKFYTLLAAFIAGSAIIVPSHAQFTSNFIDGKSNKVMGSFNKLNGDSNIFKGNSN
jgi:hypothetical protein